MFRVITNEQRGKNIYILELEKEDRGKIAGEPGQFYMLRVPDSFMVLGRPVSIMDIREDRIFFLYKVVGKGTALLASLLPGQKIDLQGPYGKGFPVSEYADKKVALVGGGMGIAPLLFAAKSLPVATLYLGLNSADLAEGQQADLETLFARYGQAKLYLDQDMTRRIDFSAYEAVMTCGPEIMMKKVAACHELVYLSLEKHMGCGVGACMSCTCQGSPLVDNKRLKVCKDGPVLHKKEVADYAGL